MTDNRMEQWRILKPYKATVIAVKTFQIEHELDSQAEALKLLVEAGMTVYAAGATKPHERKPQGHVQPLKRQ